MPEVERSELLMTGNPGVISETINSLIEHSRLSQKEYVAPTQKMNADSIHEPKKQGFASQNFFSFRLLLNLFLTPREPKSHVSDDLSTEVVLHLPRDRRMNLRFITARKSIYEALSVPGSAPPQANSMRGRFFLFPTFLPFCSHERRPWQL